MGKKTGNKEASDDATTKKLNGHREPTKERRQPETNQDAAKASTNPTTGACEVQGHLERKASAQELRPGWLRGDGPGLPR